MAKKAINDRKHLFKRGNVWWVQVMRSGKRTIMSTDQTDVAEARARRDALLEKITLTDERDRLASVQRSIENVDGRIKEIEERVPTPPLLEAWDLFKVAPKGKTARGRVIKPGERTLQDYRGRWVAFCDWMEETYPKKDSTGNRIPWEIGQIQPEHARKYIAVIDESRSGNTLNKTITFLRLVFTVLANESRQKKNPFADIEAAPHAIAKKRPLTKQELATIADLLKGKGEMELLFAMAYHTGARRGDCVLMKWGNNIDMGDRRIRYTPRKTAKGNHEITLTIGPELYFLLEATPPKRRRGYVMPEFAGIYLRDSTVLSRMITQVFKDAGIETNEPIRGYKNKIARVGLHSLRHTNITAMIDAGIPLDVVQRQAGHTTIGMTAHYHTINEKTLRAASDAVPAMITRFLPEHINATEDDVKALRKTLDRLTLDQLQALALTVKEMLAGWEKA